MRQKFMQQVEIVTESGCWIWTGQVHKNGYGRYRPSGTRQQYAHRISYEIFHGPIPPGKFVLHRCDVRLCVNPSHLYAGTQVQNMRDASERNRMPSGAKHHSKLRPETIAKGEQQWRHILTEDDVRFIRSSKLKQKELAKMFGVKQPTISNIRTRTNWKHVT